MRELAEIAETLGYELDIDDAHKAYYFGKDICVWEDEDEWTICDKRTNEVVSGTYDEIIKRLTQPKMPAKIEKWLEQHGFTYENERYAYASGSMANYVKMTVGKIVMKHSCVDDKMHPCCWIEYEKHRENGYIECDLDVRETFYAKMDELEEEIERRLR